jgi:uncharacterized protein YfbU (UPF0304 family)
MKLSDGERLIVVMLAEVMQELKIDKEIDPSLILTLAYGRDDWAIKHKYHGLFEEGQQTDPEVRETIDILWMWGIVEHSLSKLTGDEATESKSWHMNKFQGFDGNHDRHYGIASTLINEIGDFSDFKDRDLNSHSQTTLPRYREMYQKFDGYIKAEQAAPLSFDALRDLFKR